MPSALRFGLAALLTGSIGWGALSWALPQQQAGVTKGIPDPLIRFEASRAQCWVRWFDIDMRADCELETFIDPVHASRWISALRVTVGENSRKRTRWHQHPNTSVSSIRLPFIPTAFTAQSPESILIAGKEMSRTWNSVLYRYELTKPEVNADRTPGPVRAQSTELVWQSTTSGQDMIRSMRPMLGDGPRRVLVELWDSRDVWVLDSDSGEMVSRVLESSSAPESKNRNQWRLSFGFCGDHFDEGFVYAYTAEAVRGQNLESCVGVYFRDIDRDGVIDDYAPLTYERSVRLGLTDRDKYK